MVIEYPPMITGDKAADIVRMRNYLYGVADVINHNSQSPEKNETRSEQDERVGGFRKIYSSAETGITVDDSIYCENDDYKTYMYVAIIDRPGDEYAFFIPVMMFRSGALICGSASWNTNNGVVHFDVAIQTSGRKYTVKRATYVNLKDSTDSGNLPGKDGTAGAGFTIRELYAVAL